MAKQNVMQMPDNTRYKVLVAQNSETSCNQLIN